MEIDTAHDQNGRTEAATRQTGCHQPRQLPPADGDLWASTVPGKQEITIHDMRSSTGLYIAFCAKLHKKWQVDIEDCLPAELRSSTPYSLALLCRLESLSGRIKDREAAHTALLKAVAARQTTEMDQLLPRECVVFPAQLRGQGRKKHVEKKITEFRDGLTLSDVFSVHEQTLPPEQRGDTVLEKQQKAQRKVEERRKETEAINQLIELENHHRYREHRPEEEGAFEELRQQHKEAIKNAKKDRKNQRMISTHNSINTQEGSLMDLLSATAESDPSKTFTKSTKREDNTLVNSMLRAFDGPETKQKGSRREKRDRRELKRAVRAGRKGMLPSEKTAFGSLPSLYNKKLDADQRKVESDMESMAV